MADEIRVTRAPQIQHPQDTSMQNESTQRSNSKAPWIILAVVIIVIAVLAILFRSNLFIGKTSVQGYQAVFLTNGQVYFGRLSKDDGNYADLKDIYYLQVGPQQGSGTQTQAQQSITLVKLGNELHGPVDEMHISRAQILFYEDLKKDGSVVKAIEQYKASPQGASPAPAPQAAPNPVPVK